MLEWKVHIGSISCIMGIFLANKSEGSFRKQAQTLKYKKKHYRKSGNVRKGRTNSQWYEPTPGRVLIVQSVDYF